MIQYIETRKVVLHMNETVSMIDIYEEVLQRKRKRFPNGTWNYLSDAVRVIKYLIEEKLKWSDRDIKEKLNKDLFENYKLKGMLLHAFGGSAK